MAGERVECKKSSINLDPYQPRSAPFFKQEMVGAFGEGIQCQISPQRSDLQRFTTELFYQRGGKNESPNSLPSLGLFRKNTVDLNYFFPSAPLWHSCGSFFQQPGILGSESCGGHFFAEADALGAASRERQYI